MESFNWSNWSKRLLRFIATLSALHSDGPDWHWYILSQMVRMTHNPIRLVCHEWRVAATFAHKRIFFGSSSSRNGFYIACVPVSSIFDMLSNFNEELQSATSNALIEISPGRIPKVSFSMMRHCQMILKRPTSTLFSRNAPHLFIDGALVQSISNPYWLLEEMKLESIFMREVVRMVIGSS